MTLWLLLLCWGLISAQDGGEQTNAIAQSTEIQPAFSSVSGLLRKFDALMEKLKENEDQILELRNKARTKVIFSAVTGAQNHPIGPFDRDTTLIYRKVMTNIGNAYNNATGIFAAPHAGVYYFTFFYHAGGGHPVLLHLHKNDKVVAKTHDHQSIYDTADNGGNVVFLQLQQGDQVYIRMIANTHVWGDDYCTTFGGFLVAQI